MDRTSAHMVSVDQDAREAEMEVPLAAVSQCLFSHLAEPRDCGCRAYHVRNSSQRRLNRSNTRSMKIIALTITVDTKVKYARKANGKSTTSAIS